MIQCLILRKKSSMLFAHILSINLISVCKIEDLQELIEKNLLDSDSVSQIWDLIASYLPNEQLKILLLQKIIRKWIDINIRGNSFLNMYVQILK